MERQTYKKGEIVFDTDLYECAACAELKKVIRQRLKRDEKFPECSGCGDKGETEWRKTLSCLDIRRGCH